MGSLPFSGGGSGGLGGVGGLASPLGTLASSVNPSTSAALGLPEAGSGLGMPLGLLTPNSSQRDVVAAIIHEAHRRGYSPYQTTAIIADCLQESGANPRARSPNGLWEGPFQQDSSYPGRRNPNLAIEEFFNRLDRHGGPRSPDIWKSIFWLQQRPGDSSAEAAVANGEGRIPGGDPIKTPGRDCHVPQHRRNIFLLLPPAAVSSSSPSAGKFCLGGCLCG